MERPNRDAWLVMIGLLHPIAGYFVLPMIARQLGFFPSELGLLIPLVPMSGFGLLLVFRAFGVRFSLAAILLYLVWTMALGGGCF